MRGFRLDHLFAGAAIAVILAVAGPALSAGEGDAAISDAAIDAAVPMPESADMPPITPADFGAPAIEPTVSPSRGLATPASPPTTPAPTQDAASPQSDATPTAGIAATEKPALEAKESIPAQPATEASKERPAQDEAKPDEAKPAVVLTLDQQVGEKLRDLLAAKTDKIFSNKKDRAAAETFYASRTFAPLWTTEGAANARAKAAIAQLRAADVDGLDPADYPTPEFKAGADVGALAEAELKLDASLLAYARHAQTGRMHYSRVSADIYYAHAAFEPGDVLPRLAEAANVADALAAFNPPHAGYKALKAKLAELRGKSGDSAPVRIASGPVLKLGKKPMHDARVPQLRERLGVAAGSDDAYDKPLADAVAKFQRERGLAANGHLNAATVNALNGPRRERDADLIIANMERWRWLPRDLGHAYVMLNIPDYTLRVIRDGAVLWQTKVVVGKPGNHATPILTADMKFITVNPTWNVPPSIIQNEYLPALQQDPTVLDRMGLKVVQNRDGTVHIYQPPGERNALGRIRFNFPNKFLVYQHDTPDKHLFAHERRAYSHGCMRVQDPARYAEVLLSIALPKEHYTQDRIRKMFGSSEIDIRFPAPIPVHITYQTAFVDDAGKLQTREDIYGRDARTLAVLKGDERRFADMAVERAPTTITRPPRMPPGATFASGPGYYDSGPSFFERLFGGGAPPPPPAPVVRPRRTVTR
jgi:murein L,D-transpeptidase YcbB/YkuD